MKYIILSILIASMGGCGYGQFPVSKINERGEIVNANRYTQTQFDSIQYKLSTTGDGEAPYHVLNSKKINIPHYQFDSAHYYYKKESYYQNKMNAELERLNRTGHANDISKSLLRYQDSAIKYKMLLDSLKSK